MFLCLFYLVCNGNHPTFAPALREKHQHKYCNKILLIFLRKKINETFGGSVFSSIFVTLSQIRKPSLRSPRLFFRKRLLNEANKAFFEDIE